MSESMVGSEDDLSDLESLRDSGKGKEWVISRTPSASIPRRDPETKFGKDSWQCLTTLSAACVKD